MNKRKHSEHSATAKPEHTPTPWKMVMNGNQFYSLVDDAVYEEPVFIAEVRKQKDAELIVQAVNSFQSLVAALEAVNKQAGMDLEVREMVQEALLMAKTGGR